ncbi:MAG: methylmalonyl-CoA epimerase [Candidatus Xenobia bacterium]
MIERLDHVGIAVRDLDAALQRLAPLLGDKRVTREEVAGQKVRVAHIDLGNVKLELLEPTSADSAVGKFLEKRGEGLHHLSLQVADIAAVLQALQAAGLPLIDQEARPGAEGNLVAFLHPKATGSVLLELCQHPADSAADR